MWLKLFNVEVGGLHAGEEIRDLGAIVNLDAYQRGASLAVVLLRVLEQDDVLTCGEHVVKEGAKRAGRCGKVTRK